MEPYYYPLFYVESGDFFSFTAGKDEWDAAREFVFKIIRIKDATLGDTVIVRKDYRRKKLATFKAEDLISSFPGLSDIKLSKIGSRIFFSKVPIPRSSRFEVWQGVYRKGEPMMRLKKCHWIARGLTKNPVTGEIP